MAENIEPLIVDLVEFVALETRSYDDVMDAWRTNCPRLTVWEEAVSRGLVACSTAADGASIVIATDTGRTLLEREGRRPQRRSAA